MANPNDPSKDFQDILNRLDRIKVGVLPVETLETMYNDIKERQLELLKKAETHEKQIHQNVNYHSPEGGGVTG